MLRRHFDPHRPHRYVRYGRMSSDMQNPRFPEQQFANIEQIRRNVGYSWDHVKDYRDDAVSGRLCRQASQVPGDARRPLVGRVKARVISALARGERCGCGRTEGTCTELRKVEPAFWSFVRVAGIEPTNNTAERALRHAVIWRRVSGGTDSRAGSRFVERMLTAVATCRQHGRNVLDYLTSCFEARLSGRDIPWLLPN
jgi:hypothetical protein